MKFRAVTVQDRLCYFDIGDAPVSINDKLSVLFKRPKSAMLYTKSIVRGSDSGAFYETDFVMDKSAKFIGYVVYVEGFCIYNPTKGIIGKITDESEYMFADNAMRYNLEELNKVRNPITFRCGDVQFKLSRIYYATDEEVYVDLKQTRRPTYISDICLCTGVTRRGKEYYYGQRLENGTVVMHNNQPMLKLFNGEYRELERDYGMGIA